MSSLSPKAKQWWWTAVKRCLVEIFNLSPRSAAAKCRELKKSYAKHRIGDIAYHEEPLYVAESLAGVKTSFDENELRQKYLIPIMEYTQEYFDEVDKGRRT